MPCTKSNNIEDNRTRTHHIPALKSGGGEQKKKKIRKTFAKHTTQQLLLSRRIKSYGARVGNR